MELRAPKQNEHEAIRALLAGNGLPTVDLAHARVDFLVAAEGARLVGAIGLETFGEDGLLRSLVVDEGMRGSGVGRQLVEALEALALERGLRQLVLLTQTAAPFFAGLGYAAIERGTAPAPVQESAEFRSLCPASATCMIKPPGGRDARRKRVLFVCVENANRSQMAEAFAHIQGGDEVEALSAGSAPSGRIHPRAVTFMAELGYDLTAHRSKSLADIDGEFDAVVTMGCGDSCPWVPARRREDWNLPDPKHLGDAAYRAVRDEISARVRALLASL